MRTLLLLLLLIPATLSALDELDKEVVRHQVELAKLDDAHSQAMTKERQKSLTTLERLAAKQTRSGDPSGATLVWKEILRLDQDHLEARRYFTGLGTLDTVLAEVSATVDVLGNPTGGAAPRAGRRRLLLVDNANLIATGAALGMDFTTTTVELLVGNLKGDGLLFREGGSANGQEFNIAGNQLTYLVRTGSVPASITAPIDRTQPWTHLAGSFADGQLALWINGKPVTSGKAPFTTVAPHGAYCCLGGLDKGGVAIAGFRLSRVLRYQGAFTAPADLPIDAGTVLGIAAATLTPLVTQAMVVNGQPATLSTVPGAPDATMVWTASGSVGVQ